jgi:hypothetical protein
VARIADGHETADGGTSCASAGTNAQTVPAAMSKRPARI